MDIQIIALWIGLFITFVLSLINFLWGPAILARRDKVAVVNSEVYPEFLRKGTKERTRGGDVITLVCDVLSVEVTCELVLTHGKQELEVKEVEAILDKKTCQRLRRYFHLPLRNSLQLEQVLFAPILLAPKKQCDLLQKYP